MSDLSPFPTDDSTLGAIEHALNACLSMDEKDGGSPDNPVVVGADYTLSDLLDFMSGTTNDDDPRVYRTDKNGDRIEAYEANLDDELGLTKWIVDERPHYTERDIIKALIHEVRRLRSENGRSSNVDQG